MFIAIDPVSRTIVGQSFEIDADSKLEYIPIDEDLYVSLLENPALYSDYVVIKEDDKFSLIPRPDVQVSGASIVEIEQIGESEKADVVLVVTLTQLYLRAFRPLVSSKVRIIAFKGHGFEDPILDTELTESIVVDHNINIQNIVFYTQYPVVDYTYGVRYEKDLSSWI